MPAREASPFLYNQVLPSPSSDGVVNVALTSGVAQQIAIPAETRVIAFAFNGELWTAYGLNTAAIPSSYSAAGSTASSELNPTARFIDSVFTTTAISVISPYTCKGSVTFYK